MLSGKEPRHCDILYKGSTYSITSAKDEHWNHTELGTLCDLKEGSKRLTLYSNYCVEKCGVADEKVEEFPKRELGGPN